MKFYTLLFVYLAVFATTTFGWKVPNTILIRGLTYKLVTEFDQNTTDAPPYKFNYVLDYSNDQNIEPIMLTTSPHMASQDCYNFNIKIPTQTGNGVAGETTIIGVVKLDQAGEPHVANGFVHFNNAHIPEAFYPYDLDDILTTFGIWTSRRYNFSLGIGPALHL